MHYSEIMVRYGELSTKGKNRMRFINKLKRNIQSVLSIYPQVHVKADRDRTHIYLQGTDYQPVAESLKQIFGIQNFSPSYRVKKSVPALIEAVQTIMKQVYQEGMTFKITSKRSDHSFELDSRELNQTLGDAVFEAIPNVQVKMKAPDIDLRVEIREEAAYISYETIRGAGGLPVGTSGKGMLMLSGGIDSPVAGYLALKRGVDIEAVHFVSPPYTNCRARQRPQRGRVGEGVTFPIPAPTSKQPPTQRLPRPTTPKPPPSKRQKPAPPRVKPHASLKTAKRQPDNP